MLIKSMSSWDDRILTSYHFDWRDVACVLSEVIRTTDYPKTYDKRHRFLQAVIEFSTLFAGDRDKQSGLLRAADGCWGELL